MLEERIQKDYVQAMKDRDKVTSGTLSFLRAQLKSVHIDKRVEKLDDPEVITVIKKQIKQRQDSIDQFRAGAREDLVEKEAAELKILQRYIPEEMSEDAVRKIVEDVIKETKASSVKDMGAVMKAVIEKAQGRADNKIVSTAVKEALSKL